MDTATTDYGAMEQKPALQELVIQEPLLNVMME
jgi:hypothetical protein